MLIGHSGDGCKLTQKAESPTQLRHIAPGLGWQYAHQRIGLGVHCEASVDCCIPSPPQKSPRLFQRSCHPGRPDLERSSRRLPRHRC